MTYYLGTQPIVVKQRLRPVADPEGGQGVAWNLLPDSHF